VHSFTHKNTGVTIHHNSDFNGEARVVVPAALVDGKSLSELVELDDQGNLWINVIPAIALAAVSHTATIDQIIGVLEQLPLPKEYLDEHRTD
jgi:hypothetical protein